MHIKILFSLSPRCILKNSVSPHLEQFSKNCLLNGGNQLHALVCYQIEELINDYNSSPRVGNEATTVTLVSYFQDSVYQKIKTLIGSLCRPHVYLSVRLSRPFVSRLYRTEIAECTKSLKTYICSSFYISAANLNLSA